MPVSFAPTQPPISLRPGLSGTRFAGQTLTRDERIDRHLDATETPAFQQAIRDTFQQVQAYLAQKISQNQRGIVVLDIDETVLDNRGFFRDPARRYYKQTPDRKALVQAWNRWVQTSAVPVIPAARDFIDWMNRQGVPYCFITGIKDTLAPYSIKNLQQAGMIGPACLGAFYRPSNWSQSVQAFKVQKRQELEAVHHLPVLATIGDRKQDMTGVAEKDFLLPGYVEALRLENDHP